MTLKTGLVFFLPQGVATALWSHWGNFSPLGSWTCVAVKTLFLFFQGGGHDKVVHELVDSPTTMHVGNTNWT